MKPEVLNTQNNQNSIEIQVMIPNESLDNSIRQSTERAKPQVPKYDFYDITNLQEEPIDQDRNGKNGADKTVNT